MTRHIIPISGKDSLATALVQIAREPDLPYEFIFCDVEMELPETYAWLDLVEKSLGISITRIGKSLRDVIDEQNMLPSHGRRFCTKYGKIFPIRDFIAKDDAVQYLGIRADEQDRPGFTGPANIVPRYPLVEMGLGIRQVYQILEHRDILPPTFFWKRLHDQAMERTGNRLTQLVADMTPWTRAALFSWRSRSNCFMCFFQRRYEWVGLLEHHPPLFSEAEAIENRYGNVSENEILANDFMWIKDLPLGKLRGKADQIFEHRLSVVVDALNELAQGKLFKDEFDPITVTSCGLYCGK